MLQSCLTPLPRVVQQCDAPTHDTVTVLLLVQFTLPEACHVTPWIVPMARFTEVHTQLLHRYAAANVSPSSRVLPLTCAYYVLPTHWLQGGFAVNYQLMLCLAMGWMHGAFTPAHPHGSGLEDGSDCLRILGSAPVVSCT